MFHSGDDDVLSDLSVKLQIIFMHLKINQYELQHFIANCFCDQNIFLLNLSEKDNCLTTTATY